MMENILQGVILALSFSFDTQRYALFLTCASILPIIFNLFFMLYNISFFMKKVAEKFAYVNFFPELCKRKLKHTTQ